MNPLSLQPQKTVKTEVSDKPSASSSSTTVATNPFQLAQKMKLPSSKVNRITAGIARYIIDDMRPFSTVDSASFRGMISECEPRYKFPARSTFSEKVIPSMYQTVVGRVKTELKQAETVAWTTDSWTSCATKSFVTITAHFINSDLELCSRVLQTRELSESHTGEHVGNVLLEASKEWDCKVSALSTDNASNMKIAAQTAKIPVHMGCFAHTLNLASGKALNVNEVHKCLSKMRSIVGYFHRSTTAAALFNQKQKMLQLPEHKLIMDVRTRWNSSYLMVERFLEQQVAVIATLSDESLKKQSEIKSIHAASLLDQQDVYQCEQFLELMKPLYHATLAMSPDQRPTVGLVLPLLQKLKEFYIPQEQDSSFQKKIKNAILTNLQTRYTNEELVAFLEEASALDPRVKDTVQEDTWQRLHEKCLALSPTVPVKAEVEVLPQSSNMPDLPLPPDEQPETGDSTPSAPPAKRSALSFLLDPDIEIAKVEPPPTLDQQVRKEITLYREQRKLSPDSDPLNFWRDSKLTYLQRLAKIYLCVQATSVASERIFSTAGDIVTATRSCLDSDHVDQLIFLKKNFSESKDMCGVLIKM